MKINQVEELVGITKKNIRFYEEQGLLSPKRNSENGYRDYGLEDVEILKQIKFLRKLSVSIEEIRKLQLNHFTLSDCLARHKIILDRESKNIDCMLDMCNIIISKEEQLDTIQITDYLEQMEKLEKDGVHFTNVSQKDKKKKRMTASIIAAVFMIFLMLLTIIIYVYMCVSTGEQPPLLVSILLLAVPIILVGGIIFALLQRIREIKGGELDEASKY